MEPLSRALVIESPHESLDAHLSKVGIQAHRVNAVPTDAALIDALRAHKAQVLFKRSRVPVTREVIEACPDLLAVQLCCIGDDSIDKGACAEHGVLVFNDPVSNGRSVVELAIGHLIALSRRLFETDVATHANLWEKNAVGRYEVLGKRLGIVGLGNIGRQVARACEALDLKIRFFDSRLVAQEIGEEMGWHRCETLDELFSTSDLVSAHTSARDSRGADNAGLLDEVLGKLGADRPKNSPRVFLNLARGNVHSAEALLAAVQSGAVRRAAVDVYPDEPSPGGDPWVNPYAGEPRVSCTPHIGAATQEAQPRIARRVAHTMGSFSQYGAIRDCVYAPRIKLHLGDSVRGHTVLAVVHSVARGTKKAVDDAIYEAQANNLGSTHRDFDVGIAYDLSLLDRPLPRPELDRLVMRARELANDEAAIRSIRQVQIPG
jgi:D-3-phosphoglycerate dehydrogenase